MKTLLTIVSLVVISFTASAQTGTVTNDPSLVQVVEASCGQCNFGLTDQKGCSLAVKINGKAYWVEGTTIDKQGDSHGEGGLCTTVRKAEVAGSLENGKFVVSHFKLLPLEAPKTGHEGHHH